jgi:uncharacterized protein with ATP-grasp and redox domains
MSTTAENKKRFSGIASDCYSCVLNQARSAARFGELNEEQTKRVIAVAKAGLEESKTTPLLVQHIIRRVADTIIQERGESQDFDIYADVKEESNILSLAYADGFQKKLDASASPLETGLQIAAAGNIIDFGAVNQGPINLEKGTRTCRLWQHFAISPSSMMLHWRMQKRWDLIIWSRLSPAAVSIPEQFFPKQQKSFRNCLLLQM